MLVHKEIIFTDKNVWINNKYGTIRIKAPKNYYQNQIAYSKTI